MGKVFLSHSSRDKESYVNKVAEKLVKEIGESNVIYDVLTFEEGMMTLHEINNCLEKTDLFVIFISNSSLDSPWVQHELSRAKELWTKDQLSLIYPIIIDSKIDYNDSRIPEWLVKDYIVKCILRPTKAQSLIRQRLFELTWQKHPKLYERENIFVGRNTYIQSFEERTDDYQKEPPIVLVISGLRSIGRRTLARECLKKSSVIKESYRSPIISLKYDESIEDFILKLYDLGLTAEMNLTNLLQMPLEKKIDILLEMTLQIQQQKEIIFIEDEGGIINQECDMAHWFDQLILNSKLMGRITYCIISKFRYSHKYFGLISEKVFSMELSELNQKERIGLLKRISEFEDIDLSPENIKLISNLLTGYPDQVLYAISIIKEKGMPYLDKNLNLLTTYSNQKASVLIMEFESSEKKMEFLRLLIEFDTIGLNFVFEIVGLNDGYEEIIEEFLAKAICEYVGVNKEYIRVNEIVKDYLLRTEYKVSDRHRNMLSKKVKEFVTDIDMDQYDMPQFLYSLREAVATNRAIDDKYIVPSLYLKTMTDLYFNKGKNREVVQFADKALENEEFMDERIVFEIRYLLCSALAKMQNRRFLEEVQNIEGADHSFLFGFYYRQTGQYARALERLNEALAIRKNFSKAKREMVQVYIGMQEFEIAKKLAEEHYKNYPNNAHHIQAYFTCLIKGEKSKSVREQLVNLINALDNIKSETAKEMLLRCEAQLAAFYDDDFDKAIGLINKSITQYPDLNYARLIKFDICDRFNEIAMMKDIIAYFESHDQRAKYNNNIVCFKAVIMAKEGHAEEATKFFSNNIKNYTDQAVTRFKQRLLKYNQF